MINSKKKIELILVKIKICFLFLTFVVTTVKITYAQKPTFEDGVIYLSKIIAKQKLPQDLSDLEQVDYLYSVAIKFYQDDISEALLALTFATLPFDKMGVTIPLLNQKIYLKLPAVKERLFKEKVKHSPGLVYFDSDSIGNQDKDKVAHFFGNAFLAYNISFFNLSKFMGLFVEHFEATFKISGAVDFKDIITNHLGELFGKSLRENPNLKPSQFFKVYSLFFFSYY
ncbi:MAG: hypothetical protein CR986_06795 [Ignavibacteriae bacterium]|nr:MAG: hypothetical protein CR986_06795 [Ignavibacteriota bacterium]